MDVTGLERNLITRQVDPQRISRNDPCPCGSGKKYKHCCIGKGIDWSARPGGVRRLPPARPVSKPSGFSFGQFGVVDARLKSIVKERPAFQATYLVLMRKAAYIARYGFASESCAGTHIGRAVSACPWDWILRFPFPNTLWGQGVQRR
jgi:SEC-C motif-containing protein